MQNHDSDKWEELLPSDVTAISTGSLNNGQEPHEYYGNQDSILSQGQDHRDRIISNHEFESTDHNYDNDERYASLCQEVKQLRKQNLELTQKLEVVQEDAQRARRATSSNYEQQIAISQQSLIESERRLHEVEVQLDESQRGYNLLEDKHAQDLLQRDQNHAKHIVNMEEKLAMEIARVKEESREHPMIRDDDEEKAEMMKVIKDNMRKIHEEEKKVIVKNHLHEMNALHEENQKKLDDQQRELQAAANEQIQSFYQQCLKSYQTLEEDHKQVKLDLDRTSVELAERDAELKQRIEELRLKNIEVAEKKELEHWRFKHESLLDSLKQKEIDDKDRLAAFASLKEKYTEMAKEKELLEENCSTLVKKTENLEAQLMHKEDEVKSWIHKSSAREHLASNSPDLLEKGFKEWNEAALQLDEKLSSSEMSVVSSRESQVQNEEEIQSLRSIVEDYQNQQLESDNKHRREIAQLEAQLAAAESLSTDYKSQLCKLKEDHNQEVMQLQSEFEKQMENTLHKAQQEKNQEAEELSKRHGTEIERLKTLASAATVEYCNELSQLKKELESEQHHRKEDESIVSEYKEEIQSLKAVCDNHDNKLRELESAHTEKILQMQREKDEQLKAKLHEIHQRNQHNSEELIARYESDIQRLGEANIASLNESVDRASLEVAEEHMKSLREQLNGFRNQEQSYESRLAEMEKAHNEAVIAIRKQCDDDIRAEITRVENESRSERVKLEEKVLSLEREKELSEAKMRESHLKEIEEFRTTMKAEEDEKLACMQRDLEQCHQENMNSLRQHLIEEFEAKAEKERALLTKQEKSSLEELETTHSIEISKLNDTIMHAEDVIAEKYEEKIAGFRDEIVKLESKGRDSEAMRCDLSAEVTHLRQQIQEIEKDLSRVETERNQLSEDCDRHQKKAKALEVEASISKSAGDNLQKLLEEKSTLLEEKKTAFDIVAKERDELASNGDALRREVKALQQLTFTLKEEANGTTKKLAAIEDEFKNSNIEFERQLLEKDKKLSDLELRLSQYTGNLTKIEEQLQCSKDSFDISSTELEATKQELEDRNAEYQTFIGQLASKNQAFVDLQVENDSLKTSLDSLKRRHQEEVDAVEVLKKQLQGRWGESEEVESLKQKVLELVSYKEAHGDLVQKVESLKEDVQAKEKSIFEKAQSLEQVSQNCYKYEEENANYAKLTTSLQQKLQIAEEAKTGLQNQIISLENAIVKQTQATKEMEHMIVELESSVEQSKLKSQGAIADAAQETNKIKEELMDICSKLTVAQNKEKLMVAELQEKEETINDLNISIQRANQNNEALTLKFDRQSEELLEATSLLSTSSKTEENLRLQLLQKEQAMKQLNSWKSVNRSPSPSFIAENTVLELQSKINSLELSVAEKNSIIENLEHSLQDLGKKLALSEEKINQLGIENSCIQQDLLQYQRESRAPAVDKKWPEKCAEQEMVIAALEMDKEKMAQQISDLQTGLSHTNSLETKVRDQEKVISDLRTKLTTGGTNIHCLEHQSGQDLKSPLGASLTRARKSLAQRLQEKDTIERELRFRRAKLERQLAEKQCLEHLLFEKKRFELELQSQKSLLKKELEELERKNALGDKSATT